jgi:hypothetical protein
MHELQDHSGNIFYPLFVQLIEIMILNDDI